MTTVSEINAALPPGVHIRIGEPIEVAQLRILVWIANQVARDPLANLRAEVERLRDEAAESRAIRTRGLAAVAAKSRVIALTEVIDLIDKQREGQ